MLGRMFDPKRCQLEMLTAATLGSELLSAVDERKPALVCIAALPPGGLAHALYLCKRLRSRFPTLPIAVGRWGLPTNIEKNKHMLVSAGANHFAHLAVRDRQPDQPSRPPDDPTRTRTGRKTRGRSGLGRFFAR